MKSSGTQVEVGLRVSDERVSLSVCCVDQALSSSTSEQEESSLVERMVVIRNELRLVVWETHGSPADGNLFLRQRPFSFLSVTGHQRRKTTSGVVIPVIQVGVQSPP